MRYLVNVDMNQNEIKNAVLHTATEAPNNPKVGQVYTDVSGDEPKILWWNGKKWGPLGEGVPEKVPTRVLPSVSIELTGVDVSGVVEAGTAFPISYNAVFNPGSYLYGPDTGITVESWRVYDNDEPSNESTEPSGTFTDVIFGDGKSYSLTVEATYTEGAIPVTDQGTPCPSVQIPAGTVKATAGSGSGSIKSFRKYFYGAVPEILELNSDNIRSLIHSSEAISSGTSFDIKLADGTNQVIIAFPTDAGVSLTSVIDTGAFNINVYDIFTKNTVEVEGANGYDPISYDVYVYTPDVTLGANTYKVTIS